MKFHQHISKRHVHHDSTLNFKTSRLPSTSPRQQPPYSTTQTHRPFPLPRSRQRKPQPANAPLPTSSTTSPIAHQPPAISHQPALTQPPVPTGNWQLATGDWRLTTDDFFLAATPATPATLALCPGLLAPWSPLAPCPGLPGTLLPSWRASLDPSPPGENTSTASTCLSS